MELVRWYFWMRPELLPACLPGWLPALPSPVVRDSRNPFTGDLLLNASGFRRTEVTTEPEGPWGEVRCPALPVNTVDISPIGSLELAALWRALDGARHVLPEPYFAPPAYGWCVSQVPSALIDHLVLAERDEVLATAWFAMLVDEVSPEYAEDFRLETLAAALDELRNVFRRGASQGNLYVYEGAKPHGTGRAG
jgi:hypothetical protein